MDLYREELLDHYKHPRNKGTLPDPTHTSAHANRSCGDDISIQLHVEDGVIRDIAFDGQGCAVSIAAVSMVTERLKGKPLSEVDALTDNDMSDMLGTTLTPSRMNCAMLGVRVIRNALNETAETPKD